MYTLITYNGIAGHTHTRTHHLFIILFLFSYYCRVSYITYYAKTP